MPMPFSITFTLSVANRIFLTFGTGEFELAQQDEEGIHTQLPGI